MPQVGAVQGAGRIESRPTGEILLRTQFGRLDQASKVEEGRFVRPRRSDPSVRQQGLCRYNVCSRLAQHWCVGSAPLQGGWRSGCGAAIASLCIGVTNGDRNGTPRGMLASGCRVRSRWPSTIYLDLAGTFAPFRRASDRPIATACLRLVTLLPLLPLFNVPRFLFLIVRSTDFWAASP